MKGMKKKSFVSPPVSFVMSCFSEKKNRGPFILTSDTDEGAVFASVVCHSGRVFEWARLGLCSLSFQDTEKAQEWDTSSLAESPSTVIYIFSPSFFWPCWSLWKGARAIKNKKEGRSRRWLRPNETKTTFITHEKTEGFTKQIVPANFPKDTSWVNIKWRFRT